MSQMNTTTEQLTLFAEEYLVNHFQSQASKEARMILDTYGRTSSDSSNKSGQSFALLKMLVDSSQWHSTMCGLTWKVKVTPLKRVLFQLVPKLLTTDETGSLLLPTPRANESTECIETIIARRERTGVGYMNLTAAAKLWPTPNAEMWKNRGHLGNEGIQRRIRKGKQVDLSMCVSKTSGRLNPDWVEPLMGYPVGWTDLTKDNINHEITEFVGNPDDSGEPRVTERGDGRAQRLKQLGNSIVPQVVSEIFKAIKETENERVSKNKWGEG